MAIEENVNTESPRLEKGKYVLITAVHNEEKYIENTIKSIISQSVLPAKWIIVSDGSTDRTDEIIIRYSAHHSFIVLVHKKASIEGKIDFTSKVYAIGKGYDKLKHTDYDFIGILDGDVTFDSFYYEEVLNRFSENPRLGIAGGIVFDQYNDHCVRRSPTRSNFVPGCIQLFRRQCYKDIGGLFPIREGGEDTIAAVTALMKGWKVKAFEGLRIYHHKHSEATRGRFKEAFRLGRASYALGSHPLFEIFKNIKSVTTKPYLLFAAVRTWSCFLPYLLKQKRSVTEQFIQFLRAEQLNQLKQKWYNNFRH